eukprot:gene4891-5359_t
MRLTTRLTRQPFIKRALNSCHGVLSQQRAAIATARKVVFCGPHFPAGYDFTKASLAKLSPAYEVIQCQNDDDLSYHLPSADVLVPLMTRITPTILKRADCLRLIVQFGVGLEGVDIESATERDVLVARIPSLGNGNAESCAEHCLLLSMALLRDLPALQTSLQQGRLGYPLGRTLYKSKVLIFGYGAIGKALLSRVLALGVEEVVVVTRSRQNPSNHQIDDDRVTFIDVVTFQYRPELFDMDVVFMCISQNAESIGLVDAAFLHRFQRGALLINVARGGLLNYADVYHALQSGHLAGLGLDVFHTEPIPIENNPFLNHPRVVITPHVAGVTEVSYRTMGQEMANIIDNFFQHRQLPPGEVNADRLPRLRWKDV